MNWLRNSVFAALAACSLLSVAHGKEKIVIGELSWSGSTAVAHVLKAVIETRLGVDVDVKRADPAVLFAGMDKGDGLLDVYSDLWMPGQADKWAEYIDRRKTVETNVTPYKGVQRLWVPGYVQDKYNVRSVEDLKRPDVAKLFDLDGDGKGEYWPGAAGWGSANVWEVKFRSYGLDELYKPAIVDQAIFWNKLDTEYKKKRPVLFYYWTPEWVPLAYDVRPLEEPKFTGVKGDNAKSHPQYNPNGCYEMYQPKERQDWLEKSRITCANPDAEIWIAFSKSLTKRAPRVAKFLRQVKLDANEVSKWIVAIARDKVDAQDMAAAWIKANKATVDEWLKGV